MQRIACITQRPPLLPSFSVGIRHNSTEVPSTPVKRTVRVPVVRLGGVVIPSAEEIRAKAAGAKKPSYAADISYLDNASNSYLSAKLARLGRRVTTEKTQENKVPQPTPAQMPYTAPQPVPTPEDIAALTAKRREDRRIRAADEAYQHLLNYVPVPEKSDLLRSEFAKSNVFTAPARTPPKPRGYLSRPPQTRGAAREQQGASPQRKNGPRRQSTGRTRAPVARATQSVTQSMDELIDESAFQPGGHDPEFNDPEPPSSNLLEYFGPANGVTLLTESGTPTEIPISKVDSFYKSDYSRYVSASKEDYASPPDVLGAVKVAERTISHQRHYNLTARDRTLELVAQASQASTIAKLPSHR